MINTTTALDVIDTGRAAADPDDADAEPEPDVSPSTEPEPTAETAEPGTPGSVIMDLPDGLLACDLCGQPTDGPAVATAPAEALQGSRRVPVGRHHFGRCPASCRALYSRAEQVADAHPRLAARVGTRSGAVTAVVGVLVAHAALGRPEPGPGIADTDLARLIRHLSRRGLGARWCDRITRPGTCTTAPWAHLTRPDRDGATGLAVLRAGQIDAFREAEQTRALSDAPAVPLTPPSAAMIDPHGVFTRSTANTPRLPVLSGCGFCGVGAVLRPAATVERLGGPDAARLALWTWHESVDPAAVGARRAAGLRLVIALCPSCEAAAQFAGVIGPSAVERALAAHLGLSRHWTPGAWLSPAPRTYAGAVARAARRDPTAPPPAASPPGAPWAHLGDLAALRARLSEALGVPDPPETEGSR